MDNPLTFTIKVLDVSTSTKFYIFGGVGVGGGLLIFNFNSLLLDFIESSQNAVIIEMTDFLSIHISFVYIPFN